MQDTYPSEEFIKELKFLKRYVKKALEERFSNAEEIIKSRENSDPLGFDWRDYDKCREWIRIILESYPDLRDKYKEKVKGLDERLKRALGHHLSSDLMI